jgi:uncharacterized protein
VICPSCKNQTIVVERNKIELDYCPHCGGVWFDSGELELLLASLGLDEHSKFMKSIISGTEAKTTEKVRRCPHCGRKMRKSAIGEDSKILIDVCGRGDGLWFDAGELDNLLRQLNEKSSSGQISHRKVSAFLGEVFQKPKDG